ncbi:MAG: hypothetical protein RLZZ21_1377 [Planctomycetota bacterium]|jgi:hypothetical protein
MNERDTFAAAALMGLLCNLEPEGRADMDRLARIAHAQADAMLRARGASAEKDSDVRGSRNADTLASIWINYNANDYVRVRLTDHGRALLKKQHERLNAITTYLPYTPPTEDADGWSKWQLHRLLNHFGAHTGMGMPLCFEATIQFDGSRIDHDAAPAAKEADAQPSSAKRADGFTGVTQEPVAWAVADPEGRPRVLSFSRDDAVWNRKSASEKVFPLYSQPQTTLTDAERKALEWAARLAKYSLGLAEPYDALSGLLERTA